MAEVLMWIDVIYLFSQLQHRSSTTVRESQPLHTPS